MHEVLLSHSTSNSKVTCKQYKQNMQDRPRIISER